MNCEEKTIRRLYDQKSDYTSPESAQDQANSLESLSTDIYTDSKRFIYELLQNADDASSESGKLEILINIQGDYLTLSHQGEPFSEVDIESICSVGDGNKKGDENKTGFKGIGFKSVFSHSDLVIINSGDYCFRFEKDHKLFSWKEKWGNKQEWITDRTNKGKEGIVKMPWQIIPIWAELDSTFSYLNDYNVSTIIKYRNTDQLEEELFELFSNSQILLFLRTLEVKITITGSKVFTIEKVIENGITLLKQNNEVLSEWLLKTYRFDVDQSTQNLIGSDVRIPKKLRQAKLTEISFAAQLEKGSIKVADKENRLIFTYLPTSVNYNFPFLVNASFLTDAGRQHLHEDLYWNIWLFKQISKNLFLWLSELAKSKYSNEILRLIPNKFGGHSKIQQAFNSGFEEALNTTAFIPNKEGVLMKPKEVIFDKTKISDFIHGQVLIDFINDQNNSNYSLASLIFELEPISTLKRIGVKIFKIDDLKDFLASNIFAKNHKRKENFRLIEFLYRQLERMPEEEERSAWNYQLRSTAFIYDEEKNLKSPKRIYFPSLEFSDDFTDDIHFVHSKVMQEIHANSSIKRWLEFLGVKEPSDHSFIEKTIIGKKDFVTTENAIEVGRFLFEAFKKGKLTEDHFNELGRLLLLTQDGSLIEAQSAFLADFYQPELRLESHYANDFYVSEAYFRPEDIKSEWKTFFLKLSVSSTIEWKKITIQRDLLQSEYKGFFDSIPSGSPYNGYPNNFLRYSVNIISFIDYASDYAFSVKFWELIFQENVEPQPQYRDYGIHWFGRHGNKSVSLPKRLNKWIVLNESIFPTTQKNCVKASEVFVNHNWIKELAGEYLPVLDYDGAIPEDWLDFLPVKKTLDLDDYLTVLTAIWQDKVKDDTQRKENKKRIKLIYEGLAANYLRYSEKLKRWASSNKLLAKDGKSFYYPNELSVVTVDGFRAPTLAYCDEKNKDVIELLDCFGVNIIDTVVPEISNSSIEIKDLKRQIDHILPLIAVVSVEKSKSKKDWEQEYDRLKNRLVTASFFKTTAIQLSYGNDQDKQQKSSWAIENNFYYVGNWYKPRVLDGLVEPIGQFLGIRYAERHLSVLLSDSFLEGIEYIREKFGEEAISLIPERLLNTEEPAIIHSNVGNRAYNQSDEDIGHAGELFVYEELRRIYTEKYNYPVTETIAGFKVGTMLEVIWRNKSERTFFDHDFKILEGEAEIFIDSKATPYGEYVEKVPFYISSSEFKLMENAKIYLIARVFNVMDAPSVKFVKLKIEQLE